MGARSVSPRLEAFEKPRPLINRDAQSFAKRSILGISMSMSAERINDAMGRINAAMARIDAARLDLSSATKEPSDAAPTKDSAAKDGPAKDSPGSARIMALVNAHEKLREEVADTLSELDSVIEELEGE